MLALAARCGLGDNTQMLGLGDLGSSLPESFDDAFVGYKSIYSADWKHVRDYVQNATAVLNPLCSKSDTENWDEQMCSAIWQRDRLRCDELLHEANQRKDKDLVKGHGTLPRGRLADLHLEQLEPDERGAIQGHGRRRR
jgi:hypothetical protein